MLSTEHARRGYLVAQRAPLFGAQKAWAKGGSATRSSQSPRTAKKHEEKKRMCPSVLDSCSCRSVVLDAPPLQSHSSSEDLHEAPYPTSSRWGFAHGFRSVGQLLPGSHAWSGSESCDPTLRDFTNKWALLGTLAPENSQQASIDGGWDHRRCDQKPTTGFSISNYPRTRSSGCPLHPSLEHGEARFQGGHRSKSERELKVQECPSVPQVCGMGRARSLNREGAGSSVDGHPRILESLPFGPGGCCQRLYRILSSNHRGFDRKLSIPLPRPPATGPKTESLGFHH